METLQNKSDLAIHKRRLRLPNSADISAVKQALLYHKDIDFNARIDYIGQPIEWASIVNRLKKAMHDPDMTFGQPE